jgi:hypothetical protein
MHTNLSAFPARLAEACRARDISAAKVCSGIGLGGKRAVTLSLTGPGALDVYRLCQIADTLDVSLDWLVGRSNVMSVMEMPELPDPPKRPRKEAAIAAAEFELSLRRTIGRQHIEASRERTTIRNCY